MQRYFNGTKHFYLMQTRHKWLNVATYSEASADAPYTYRAQEKYEMSEISLGPKSR